MRPQKAAAATRYRDGGRVEEGSVTSADGVRIVDDVEVVMDGEMSLSNHRGTAHTHTYHHRRYQVSITDHRRIFHSPRNGP